MSTVPGFSPSTSGLHFSNSSFPHLALLSIPTPFGNIDIGDSAMGVCGGMVFTVRDFFEAKSVPPLTNQPPSSETDRLYTYMVNRFFASFNLPGGPARYYSLMDPALPDHETELSKLGLAPHGRAWVMIVEEWPKIKADIDSGHPSPIGLVTVKSLNPVDLGHNHVVLVYGYDLNGTDLTMHVYDPNNPDNNSITLSLSISNPDQTTQVSYGDPGLPTPNCFFHLDYTPVTPAQNASCASQTPPPILLTPGQSYNVSVTMQNTGITTWVHGGSTPYRLGSQNPQDNTVWGLNRIDVSGQVPPGASATFNFVAHAPSSVGIYQFQWRMVQEAVTWFGDLTPDVQTTIPKHTKDGKEGKEAGKDHKELRDNTQISSPGTQDQLQPVEAGAQPAGGQTFIASSERPSVGEQALKEQQGA